MYLKSRTGLIGTVTAGAAAVNLVANYFLILRFGMIGAAWATVLGFLVIAVGSYIGSQRVCPLALAHRPRRENGSCGDCASICLSSVLPIVFLGNYLAGKERPDHSFPGFAVAHRVFWWTDEEYATLHSLRASAVRLTLRVLRPAWLRI